MSELWNNLSRRTFIGSGHLTCDNFSEEWKCDFCIAQLINGRIVIQVSGLKDSVFSRLHNLLDRIDTFTITGELEQGYKLKATEINLSWTMFSFNDKDYFEGYVTSPGFVEITHPRYADAFYSKIVYEVTNLSLGRQHDVEATIEGAKIRVHRIPKSNDVLRYARGLKTSRILSAISVDLLERPSSDNSRELISDLCSLLTLAQRSCVHKVASHWQDPDGVTKRSLYQEPVFEYPPAPRPLIPAEALGSFLEDTFKNYNEKWNIWKLPWAIDYYVQSMSLRHVFAQSIGFFTALETLKDAFLKQPGREGLEYYVTRGQFKKKKISDKVLNILSETFEEFRNLLADTSDTSEEKAVERQTLKSKVGELNRRAYKLVLREMFSELGIIVDDNDLKLLVDLRNKIIHSGTPNYESDRWPNLTEAAN